MVFVLLNHSGDMVWNYVSKGGFQDLLGGLFFDFRFGVEIFFTLSGFLIGYLYDFRGKTKAFLLSRFFRLWPLWALFGGVWLYFHVQVIKDLSLVQATLNYAANLFFLGWVVPGPNNWFIGGQWSIQIEIFCYLLFLLVRGRSNSSVLFLAGGLNLFGIFSATAIRSIAPALADAVSKLSVWSGFTFFAVGIVLARIYQSDNRGGFIREILSNSKSRIALIVLLLSTLLAPAFFGNWLGSLGLVTGGIVLAIAVNSSVLAGRSLRWFGRHSYFVFFSHFFVIMFLNEKLNGLKDLSLLVGISLVTLTSVITLLICSVGAWLSMRYIEKPALRIGHKFATKDA
jgi:peptidoglycan/LPS O-acetylase OafA/YrhL